MKLHERLSGHIDTFVEVLLGKIVPNRIQYKKSTAPIHDVNDKTAFVTHMVRYRSMLIELSNVLDSKADTDLLTIVHK